jgi:hypothetical protein
MLIQQLNRFLRGSSSIDLIVPSKQGFESYEVIFLVIEI